MKVRSDFVTNSSSSSFILAFTNKDSVKEELTLYMEANGLCEYTDRVLYDVYKHGASKDEIIAIFSEEAKGDVDYALWEHYLDFKFNNDYEKFHRWFKDPENKKYFESLVAKETERKTERFRNDISGSEYFSYIEYGDDCDPELESSLRILPCVVEWFSHH